MGHYQDRRRSGLILFVVVIGLSLGRELFVAADNKTDVVSEEDVVDDVPFSPWFQTLRSLIANEQAKKSKAPSYPK